MQKIYADNAATTRISEAARAAYIESIDENFGNASSLHSFGQQAAKALHKSREIIARYINAEPREIYFTSGGSESCNQAVLTGAKYADARGKRHIISSRIEHHSVLHPLEKLKREGFELTLLECGRNGLINPAELSAAIREDTGFVTLICANNEIGVIQPMREIGEICRDRTILLHTDAVQAGGKIELDVRAQHIDMLSLAAHKFHGPKGAGVLYCTKKIQPETLIRGGSHERGKRAGTENVPAIAAMAAAFEESCLNMREHNAHVLKLRGRLIAGLSQIPCSIINGDLKSRIAGNVNMCFEGVEGEALLLMLDMRGIAASSGSACTSGSLDPSHVLLALGLPHEIAHGSLRLSLSHDNTEQEIDRIIEVLPGIISSLRGMSPVWAKIEKGEETSKIGEFM